MKNLTLRYIHCFLFCLASHINFATYAVPAYPNKVIVTTNDCDSVVIYMRGDEFQKFAVTEDGYTLINDFDGWWYATSLEDGRIGKSRFRLMPYENESPEIIQFKAINPKGMIPKRIIPNQYNLISKQTESSPLIGERRALVILMQFKDLQFKKTKENFSALFNDIDYQANDATGSVRDYYKFASQGQLDYISDIYGPYTSQYPMKYYGGNDANGNDSNPIQLCIEAIKNLPPSFDSSLYDNDGDGVIDNVHIIFAGYGEEAGASSDAIWAHEYPAQINSAGYSFANYSCSPELRDNRGNNITNIGVICHELGHALGAKDYYDTNYGSGGEYDGTGEWDIMASGSWNNDGLTPPNFNPYVRSIVFGWNSQVLLNSDEEILMPRMEYGNSDQTVIYKMETESSGDYFLLENRQLHEFDAALPGEGLIIYHVHPNIDNIYSNTVNATHPQGLYPVCASYSEPTSKNYGNINSDECPFPGSRNIKSFSATTSPAAIAWDGSVSKISISDISLDSVKGTISFNTKSKADSDTTDLSGTENLIYRESFETNIDETMDVNSINGQEIWRIYKKGDFVINSELIPSPSDGEKLLMLYSAKGYSVSESEIISPEIKINEDVNYSISFDIYCNTKSSLTPNFELFIEDENGIYNIYSKKGIVEEWETVTLPLIITGEKFRYKLYGCINAGGIFIDNIKLFESGIDSSINPVSVLKSETECCVYHLNGTFVGRLSNLNNIPAGFYLIRQGNSTRKLIVK